MAIQHNLRVRWVFYFLNSTHLVSVRLKNYPLLDHRSHKKANRCEGKIFVPFVANAKNWLYKKGNLAVVHFGRADKCSTVPPVKQLVARGNQRCVCVCVQTLSTQTAEKWKKGREGKDEGRGSSLTLSIPQCCVLGVRGGWESSLGFTG